MAYSEYLRFEEKQLGGPGVEVETDVFQLGKKPKNGLGFHSLSRAYVQFTGERNGNFSLNPFPNPRGGPEALRQIEGELKRLVAPQSIVNSDGVRAVRCFMLLHENLELYHFIIKHCHAKFHGFVWYLFINNQDGGIFSDIPEGECRQYEVHTQTADGAASLVKDALKSRGGGTRKNLKAELKEIQYRHNIGSGDIYSTFMHDWGVLEDHLHKKIVTMEFVHNLVKWNHEAYDEAPEFFPTWECPGCDFVSDPSDWKKDRKEHKKSCKFYQLEQKRTFEHGKARCTCCIRPYHDSNKSQPAKLKATRSTNLIKKRKRKQKIKKKCPNPNCNSYITDTAQSRWLHRQQYQQCKTLYYNQKNKKK